MRFEASSDIDAPPPDVHAVLSDPDWVRDMATARGITATQGDDGTSAPRARWAVTYGAGRRADLRVTESRPPTLLRLEGLFEGLDVTLSILLAATSPDCTGLTVSAAISPRTLAGRLLMPPLRLARAQIDRRFGLEVAAIADDIARRTGGSG
jgi:hypothetical protein